MKQITKRETIEPPLLKISFGIFFLLSIFSFFLGYASRDVIFAQEREDNSWIYFSKVLDKKDPFIEKISQGPKLITVQKGTEVTKIFTTSCDIKDILKKNGIEVTENDLIYLNSEYLVDGSIVKIIRTESIVVEEQIAVPYETETRKTSKYAKGEEHVVQKGVLGIKRQMVLLYYEDGILISEKVLDEIVEKEARKEIVEIGTSWYSFEGIVIRGYNCSYWYSVVDNSPYSQEEKRWLKYIMYCESGCNAESNKSSYKGLFQWSPLWWRKQFSENIFDGHAQIRHTIAKYRAGEATRASQWPACHARYVRAYGVN